ncbi:MAG: ABC transporter ATP-binding protein [Candidatus Dormibacteria bacterium]
MTESSGKAAVLAEALTRDYGSGRGLFDLDLEVPPCQVFGFLGPNGSGKSTTIRLLMGLIRASSGSARVFGVDPATSPVEVRRMCAYVPGELPQYGGMRGGQVLDLFAGLRGGVDRAWLAQLCDRLDLDLGRRYRDYSRGNKQKLALAGAFMVRPRLLILDEPTSGLDPLVQQEFYALVREARDSGSTVFLSSHVFAEVEHTCDHVGIIREGRLVRAAALADLHDLRIRRVRASYVGQLVEAGVSQLPGVRGVVLGGGTLQCDVQGSFTPLLRALGQVEVISLVSEEPSLEEVFLTYYGKATQEGV